MAEVKRVSSNREIGCGPLLRGILSRWIDRPRRPALPEKAANRVVHATRKSVLIENPKNPPKHEIKTPKKITFQELGKPKPVNQTKNSNPSDAIRNSISRNDHKRFGENGLMGNILVKRPRDVLPRKQNSRGLDPDIVKRIGNEAYTRGRYGEALVFYEKAIALDARKATYHCNKGAALIGLGRLIEALDECREAVRLEPNYQRAHQRLARLYQRLGVADKALYHYKQGGGYIDKKDSNQTENLKQCLLRCSKARKSNVWNGLLDEARSAVSLGADSSPKVFAMQAEALLQLHRHQEAYETYQKGLKICTDSCIRFFDVSVSSYHSMIGARVYMAAGRFEDAVMMAQKAYQLDPSNDEAVSVVNRARAVASARLSGNLLYKASDFTRACLVYTKGLEHEPNAVLLCNRAACRLKLGQFEKAAEDCTATLRLLPSYSKAVRRRADCYTKLEKWKAAIGDYEFLLREAPEDEETRRALSEAKAQFGKQIGEDSKDTNVYFLRKSEKNSILSNSSRSR